MVKLASSYVMIVRVGYWKKNQYQLSATQILR